MTHEIRSHAPLAEPLELDTEKGKTLRGYAIVYNSLSRDLGGFKERFMPGSVSNTIKSGLLIAVQDHDDSKPLGSQEGGTLRTKETSKGLYVEIDLPDTSYVRDMEAMHKNGDYKGLSFKFAPAQGGYVWKRENGETIHEVREAKLDHISPVIRPAYAATSMSIRGLVGEPEAIDMIERYGIDLDELAKIFCAANKGLEITKAEKEIAQHAERMLRVIRTPRLNGARDRAASLLM